MVILIGGPGCTGKTLIAQRLLERYHLPYLCQDHLKMGLVRGWPGCGFGPEDPDDKIAKKLWPVTEGIIRTNIENRQSMIIEGCYLPPQEVARLQGEYPGQIIPLYLLFAPAYIQSHWQSGIQAHRDVVEARLYPEARTVAEYTAEHEAWRKACMQANAQVFEVAQEYDADLQRAYTWIEQQIKQNKNQLGQ